LARPIYAHVISAFVLIVTLEASVVAQSSRRVAGAREARVGGRADDRRVDTSAGGAVASVGSAHVLVVAVQRHVLTHARRCIAAAGRAQVGRVALKYSVLARVISVTCHAHLIRAEVVVIAGHRLLLALPISRVADVGIAHISCGASNRRQSRPRVSAEVTVGAEVVLAAKLRVTAVVSASPVIVACAIGAVATASLLVTHINGADAVILAVCNRLASSEVAGVRDGSIDTLAVLTCIDSARVSVIAVHGDIIASAVDAGGRRARVGCVAHHCRLEGRRVSTQVAGLFSVHAALHWVAGVK